MWNTAENALRKILDEMLLDKEIDSVHICTPHHLHFEMIKKALAAGKDVVCEKPVTRTKEEYEAAHIPGAINVPNEAIKVKEPKELPDKEQLILVYCRSGNRSKQASQKLADMGYTNIVEFGGINDWSGETVSGK